MHNKTDIIVEEIVDVLTVLTTTHLLQDEKDLIRSTMVLAAHLANDWIDRHDEDESFKTFCCIDAKLLTAILLP
jgi:hypothetical protein